MLADRMAHEAEGQGVLVRLACARDGESGFLAPHQLEAGNRLARLFQRARLNQRVTMSYDPTRIGGPAGRPMQGELADSAADARQKLGQFAGRLPSDCWGVLIDVCGFEKGLQIIETERRWPRRSAKLVLRIGLEQLASIMGLDAGAQGRAHTATRNWLPERPAMFEEAEPRA